MSSNLFPLYIHSVKIELECLLLTSSKAYVENVLGFFFKHPFEYILMLPCEHTKPETDMYTQSLLELEKQSCDFGNFSLPVSALSGFQ